MNGETNRTDNTARQAVIIFACLAASLFYGLCLMFCPPVVQFTLPGKQVLVLWNEILVFKTRWPLVAIGLVLSILTTAAYRRTKSNPEKCAIPIRVKNIIHYLMPLALLPLFGVMLLLGDILPTDIVSNTVLFGPALVASLILARLAARFLSTESGDSGREWSLLIFVVSTVFYACIGYYLASVTGEHVGDEGHYLIQAKSLYFDHDLDIKNNFIEKGGEYAHDYDVSKSLLKLAARQKLSSISELLHYVHISPRSRNGHWHSNHPFGLPLILAPLWGLGMLVRYISLGMIAAFGNLAMYKTARGLGAGRNAALVTVLCFGSSIYWTIYSARTLPEVLGATLLCWVFWAVLMQEKKPWVSVAIGGICCGYLPMAHERFLAPSLMGFGFYGLFGLFSSEKWPRKIGRLVVFTILSFVGYGIYYLFQCMMFEKGLKYELNEGFISMLFGYPLGMWGVIADWRGVSPMLPAFIWLAGALFAWLVSPAITLRNRLFALALGVTFCIVLLTSCASGVYVGGKCLPGRYILVAVPLLVPGAALLLDRASSLGRWWFLFLCATSTVLLVLVLIFLPIIGRGFIFPINNLAACHPILKSLFSPHASFHYYYPEHWNIGLTATTILVAGGIVLTAIALLIPERKKALAIPLVLLIVGLAAWSHTAQARQTPIESGEDMLLPKYLSRISPDRVYVSTRLNFPTNLFDVSRLTFRDFLLATSTVGVTTFDLGARMAGNMISQPHLEANDWAGRGFKWTTLTAPFKPMPGGQILHIAGAMTGNATPVFVLRQGSKTLFEGPLPVVDGKVDHNFIFHCRRYSGHLYILARLADGEGTFSLKELYWSPFGAQLVEDTNILLPANVTVVGNENCKTSE